MQETLVFFKHRDKVRPSQDSQMVIINSILIAITAIFWVWGVWRASFPMEISRNESWDAWQVSSILNGQGLYPRENGLIVNNYPPLSFYVVAFVSLFTSDVIYAGRIVSIISTFLLSFEVFLCIRSFGFSRAAGAFGAIWFLGTAAHFFWTYVFMNDPNMLGLAIMGLGFVIFLRRMSSGRSVEPAVACMVLAGFFKHNFIVFPLTVFILLWRFRWQLAVRAAVFGLLLTIAGLCICTFVYGSVFLDNLLLPREMSFARAMTFLSPRAATFLPLLCVWAYWAHLKRAEAAVQFSAILIALSFAAAFALKSGDGVGSNAWLELLFSVSVGGGMAVEGILQTPFAIRFGFPRTLWIITAVLAVRLFTEAPEPYSFYFDSNYREQVRNSADVLKAEIERVKAIPDPVSCIRHLVVCYRAGKAYVFDDFVANELVATKHLSEDELKQKIADLNIRFVKIDDAVAVKKQALFR